MVPTSALVAAEAVPASVVMQWVVFDCAGERFGIPLSQVVEIVTPRVFTRLPGAGPEVCGLAAVRGRIVTVLDLGVVLGRGPSAAVADYRLLLLERSPRRVGLVVDEVVAIATSAAEPPTVPAPHAEGVVGTGRSDEGRFTALDPQPFIGRLLQS